MSDIQSPNYDLQGVMMKFMVLMPGWLNFQYRVPRYWQSFVNRVLQYLDLYSHRVALILIKFWILQGADFCINFCKFTFESYKMFTIKKLSHITFHNDSQFESILTFPPPCIYIKYVLIFVIYSTVTWNWPICLICTYV